MLRRECFKSKYKLGPLRLEIEEVRRFSGSLRVVEVKLPDFWGQVLLVFKLRFLFVKVTFGLRITS